MIPTFKDPVARELYTLENYYAAMAERHPFGSGKSERYAAKAKTVKDVIEYLSRRGLLDVETVLYSDAHMSSDDNNH